VHFAIVRRDMRLLYNILYPIAFVLMSPVFLVKMVKRGKYRENFFQRFGRYQPEVRQRLATKAGQRCWLQAVSVGEINLALHLIPALQSRLPGLEIVLTTTTSTGYALAKSRLPQGVTLLYFPQDFLPCVKRAYRLIQPDFIVLMESELWPNHIWAASDRHLPIFLVNARMSPRSARRYRRFQWVTRFVFRHLTLVCAQSREDAAHYAALVGSPDRVVFTGNMKFDTSLPQQTGGGIDPSALRDELGLLLNQPVLLGGSTHPGEEAVLFDIFQNLRRECPRLFLVIVPRHVERSPEILEVALEKGLSCLLRSDMKSSLKPKGGQYDCLLVDTTGELKWLYGIATVIFVGKSLVGQGGQNIIEGAASGRPVVFGPHMQNFREIARLFVEANACVQVNDPLGLQRACATLLGDEKQRAEIAKSARAVIDANLGATDRTVDLVTRAMASDVGTQPH
jgi:3-deoxy-D-manno-octulosonic-acid transferase